ncbi:MULTISPECIES: 4Fe-4S binding protein [Marinilabiliaceae]|uniref:4Fe-4S binding protein n=1 Tax=Plebeiibacterium marinum TaxID=2992111 RepID=A0AAE3MFN5_9BACT|nr:4Fe-4S binding protein [Plebeiobacterium marinum]MCU4164340.1 4Fe-4S binding protein [Marinilabiliaceae bacterium A049]MCW3806706.1 4Fe-4S binding protein [Plebeiobacterium marinum]
MEYPVVNKEECTGCGVCVEVCPMAAIELIDGKAQINNEKCRNCGLCLGECPVGAIKD